MEEAWELAALGGVDMFNNMISPASLYSQQPHAVSLKEFSSEFSDKFEKSKNKLIYASVFSITVGLFVIRQDTSFLGLKLEGLSDRRLEWMAWVAAAFFFANTMLRFFDERRSAETYKNQVARLRAEFGDVLQSFRDVISEVKKILGKESNIDRALDGLVRRSKRTIETQDFFLTESENSKKAIAEYQYTIQRVLKDTSDLKEKNSYALNELKRFPKRLDDFEKRTKPVRKYRNIGGFRVLIFDLILPCALFLFASLVQFLPSFKKLILDNFPA